MSNQNDINKKKEIDNATGVETTGHEWDGLKELNNPLPRWWLWVFYISIIWSLWYFWVYPSWPVPGGATKGSSGYTQFRELSDSQQEIHAKQAAYLGKFEKATFDEIMNDKELYAFAIAGGGAAFKDNCATCHGTGAEGGKGYPNLNDDDWLWGGTLEDIHFTLQNGIRAGDEDSRISQMPAFGRDKLLSEADIHKVVSYVAGLKDGKSTTAHEGYEIFQQQCASCHGTDAKGLREFGAPNLSDDIWLYGSSEQNIFETVYNARAGVMPLWKSRLDENTIKQLTVYVHQLGGGEKSEPIPPSATDESVLKQEQGNGQQEKPE